MADAAHDVAQLAAAQLNRRRGGGVDWLRHHRQRQQKLRNFAHEHYHCWNKKQVTLSYVKTRIVRKNVDICIGKVSTLTCYYFVELEWLFVLFLECNVSW